MNNLTSLIAHHGYLVICVVVFAEAIGVPVPGAVALVAGGAAAASGVLHPAAVVLFAVAGMLAADSLLYVLGRVTGWALLKFLCRVSIDPETCVLHSAESFYKRGRTTLLIAKFIPGVSTMAAPLAGSMKMPFPQFLGLDFLGACIYALSYGAVGFIFRDFIAKIIGGFRAAGHAVEIVVVVGVIAFMVYRFTHYWRHREDRIVPRVHVAEVAAKLQTEGPGKIMLADVRSHGYYSAGAVRIRGSIRIEPNNLSDEIKKFPRDKDMYLYCTCRSEATSASVAHLLREQGFKAFVIVGGLTAWRKAGEPLEPVPEADLVHLPTFSR
ncbi:MAG: VTT domain-containing protein [Candidatus Acidiferrum sp.]|jgi:membrane protein DedA with SNARE-associated domain/rhodanese-related sulfurtransferase